MLTDAAIRGAKDDLRGIPAGNRLPPVRGLGIEPPAGFEPPPPSELAAEGPGPLPLIAEEVEAV